MEVFHMNNVILVRWEQRWVYLNSLRESASSGMSVMSSWRRDEQPVNYPDITVLRHAIITCFKRNRCSDRAGNLNIMLYVHCCVYQNSVGEAAFERHLQVGQRGLDFIHLRLVGAVQRFTGQRQLTDVVLR